MTALPGPAQRRRRGLPVVLFVAALMLSVTVAEVAVILQTGRLIGPWWTLAMLVAMGLVGSWLWKREGIRAWRALSQAFESGRLPAGELTDAALVLVGGILLMLPGFLTDFVGLFFLVPVTRPLARRLIAALVGRTAASRGLDLGVLRGMVERDTVMRGETVDAPGPGARPETVTLRGEVLP